jgi:adenine/guanine phosphoribosyltransferase-like PRPP-binding protein
MPADHLKSILSPNTLNKKVDKIIALIKASRLNPQKIACRGLSDTIVASIVSSRLGIPLILVRKRRTKHSVYKVETIYSGSKSYIIIDDFIDTGNTVYSIIRDIKKECRSWKCLGIFLYSEVLTTRLFYCRNQEIPIFSSMKNIKSHKLK